MKRFYENKCILYRIITIMIILKGFQLEESNMQRFNSPAGDVGFSSPESANSKLHLLPSTVPKSLAQRMAKPGPVLEVQGNEKKYTNNIPINSILDFQNKATEKADNEILNNQKDNQPRSLQMTSNPLNLQNIIDSVMNKPPKPTAKPNIPFDVTPNIIYHKPSKQHNKLKKQKRRLSSDIGSVSYPYGPPASVTPQFLPPNVLNVDYTKKDVLSKVANAVQIKEPATNGYFSTLVDADVMKTGVQAMSSFNNSNKGLKNIHDKLALITRRLKETKILSAQTNAQMNIRINKLHDMLRSVRALS